MNYNLQMSVLETFNKASAIEDLKKEIFDRLKKVDPALCLNDRGCIESGNLKPEIKTLCGMHLVVDLEKKVVFQRESQQLKFQGQPGIAAFLSMIETWPKAGESRGYVLSIDDRKQPYGLQSALSTYQPKAFIYLSEIEKENEEQAYCNIKALEGLVIKKMDRQITVDPEIFQRLLGVCRQVDVDHQIEVSQWAEDSLYRYQLYEKGYSVGAMSCPFEKNENFRVYDQKAIEAMAKVLCHL